MSQFFSICKVCVYLGNNLLHCAHSFYNTAIHTSLQLVKESSIDNASRTFHASYMMELSFSSPSSSPNTHHTWMTIFIQCNHQILQDSPYRCEQNCGIHSDNSLALVALSSHCHPDLPISCCHISP